MSIRKFSDKSKPEATQGRRATGPHWVAEPPKRYVSFVGMSF